MVGICILLGFFGCFQVGKRDDQDYDAHDDKEKNSYPRGNDVVNW